MRSARAPPAPGCATLDSMPAAGPELMQSSLRRAATGALAMLVAVAVLLAVVRGGTRFFYCPMTHLAFDESPCASPRDEADEADEAGDSDEPAVRTPDCCEERWRAAAPTASVPKFEAPSVASAALVAVLPPPALDIASSHAKLPFGLARAVRAGPPPPSASERRAMLMVFHI